MLNKILISGRISKDFELKKTNNGSSVVNFTLAVERMFKTDDTKVDYIECVAWNKYADNLVKYCKKGSTLEIVGRIQTRSYQNSDGKYVKIWEVYCEELHFLGNPRASKEEIEELKEKRKQEQQEKDMFDQAENNFDIMDSDIQF